MRVTITDLDHDSHDIERGVAEAEGVEFSFIDGGVDAATDPRVKGSDGLVVQYAKVDAAAMDFLLPELKVIGRYGVGVDTIDLDAAEERGITVVNVPDYGTQSVADHAIALVLAVVRNLPKLEEVARSSSMEAVLGAPIHQFCDMTLGVAGFGAIGRALAEKARGVGFTTIVTDPMIPAGTAEVDGFEVVSFEELLGRSDVVSIHLPLLPSTKHLINDETIALMKDGAFLVNTARGGVVDTDALVRALESGKIAGAGLDVLETEPVPADHPLTKLPRVILTPHAAYYSAESYALLKQRAIGNVIAILKGRECRHVVVPRKR